MFKLIRSAAALLLLLWMGVLVTLTFYVAPSLFGNESGAVPNSSVAGEIISPLLHKLDVTGWVVLPVVLLFHFFLWQAIRPRAARLLLVSSVLLAVAWAGGLYTGLPLTKELHSIRMELKERFGGYHLAPKDDPERQRFARLHGLAMTITLANLALGLGSLLCLLMLDPEGVASPGAARDDEARPSAQARAPSAAPR